MFQLEDSDVEVCDEIYESYTDLLQETEEEEDSLCYKSYFLVRGKTPKSETRWEAQAFVLSIYSSFS